MVDFAVNGGPLKALDIKVAAASVDTIEQVAELKAGLRVGYRMYAELDVHEVSDATGAKFQTGDRVNLHATGFLLKPDGTVSDSLYSSGPLGRLTASEVMRKTVFARANS